ncbi:hypothetical protein G6F56_014154 [Rhizopus delemar]|nr:hypothetical protein G6F56_014154 [Rhizopus delemar]
MRQCLTDIQTGVYAKKFILENTAGAPTLTSRRRINAESQIEQVGGTLRAMMPWIAANKLVDNGQSGMPARACRFFLAYCSGTRLALSRKRGQMG